MAYNNNESKYHDTTLITINVSTVRPNQPDLWLSVKEGETLRSVATRVSEELGEPIRLLDARYERNKTKNLQQQFHIVEREVNEAQEVSLIGRYKAIRGGKRTKRQKRSNKRAKRTHRNRNKRV
jgi:hypothetical protein